MFFCIPASSKISIISSEVRPPVTIGRETPGQKALFELLWNCYVYRFQTDWKVD